MLKLESIWMLKIHILLKHSPNKSQESIAHKRNKLLLTLPNESEDMQ